MQNTAFFKLEILGTTGDTHIFICHEDFLADFVVHFLSNHEPFDDSDALVICNAMHRMKVEHNGITAATNRR